MAAEESLSFALLANWAAMSRRVSLTSKTSVP